MTRFLFCVFFSVVLVTGCEERTEEKAMEKKIEEATVMTDWYDRTIRNQNHFSLTSNNDVSCNPDF